MNLTKKQRKIATLKAQGKDNPEIGAVVYPDANPTSQRQIVYQNLKKPHVAQYLEQQKLIALKKHAISWDRVMSVVSEGLSDSSMNTRLRAARQASEYLSMKGSAEDETPQLSNLPEDVDEIQLVRLLKNK